MEDLKELFSKILAELKEINEKLDKKPEYQTKESGPTIQDLTQSVRMGTVKVR